MTSIIQIPEPCHENWNAMRAAEQGRHCSECRKTVIDFTTWQPGDIAGYLADPANKKTCGRFLKTQLEGDIPASVSEWIKRICQSSLSSFQKIAAVIIVVFSIMGTGCKKPMINEATDPIFIKESNTTVGEVQPIEMMGDIEMMQDNDSSSVCRTR